MDGEMSSMDGCVIRGCHPWMTLPSVDAIHGRHLWMKTTDDGHGRSNNMLIKDVLLREKLWQFQVPMSKVVCNRGPGFDSWLNLQQIAVNILLHSCHTLVKLLQSEVHFKKA